MSESRGLKAILIVLALTLVILGGWRLVNPIGFYAFTGLELPDEAGMLSEVRGAGGVIMVAGRGYRPGDGHRAGGRRAGALCVRQVPGRDGQPGVTPRSGSGTARARRGERPAEVRFAQADAVVFEGPIASAEAPDVGLGSRSDPHHGAAATAMRTLRATISLDELDHQLSSHPLQSHGRDGVWRVPRSSAHGTAAVGQ